MFNFDVMGNIFKFHPFTNIIKIYIKTVIKTDLFCTELFLQIVLDLKYCQEIYSRGSRSDGIFTINIPEIGPSNVRCDMTTGNGGWIVFQRRVDATVDFNRNWVDHKVGFGDLDGNFWLGLEKIHQLAAPGKGAKLRVDVKPVRYPGVSQHAEYSRFEIGDESDGYRLRIGGYTGNAGDHLAYHDNMKFSTNDRDQDMSSGNCAVEVVSAWWFNNCRDSNLNGLYPPNSELDSSYMIWGPRISNFSEMKIKY